MNTVPNSAIMNYISKSNPNIINEVNSISTEQNSTPNVISNPTDENQDQRDTYSDSDDSDSA